MELEKDNIFTINGNRAEDRNGFLKLDLKADEYICRNHTWDILDWNIICSELHCTMTEVGKFGYIMCENQCKTNEMAVKALKNYFKHRDDTSLSEMLSYYKKEACRMKYIRSHYNDTEDDNMERQEVRCLNG